MICRPRQVYSVLFFFQAEDGIRDLTVTGVQTCALPICQHLLVAGHRRVEHGFADPGRPRTERVPDRSEERRVGKECRSRSSPNHQTKKHATRTAHDTANSSTIDRTTRDEGNPLYSTIRT